MENEVVISGIGAKFPDSYNYEEFKSKLLHGETLFRNDSDRSVKQENKPLSSGRIPDWRHFDPTFFGLHPNLAQNSDPAKGLILERSFEAILDSGINPFDIKGRNVAVLVAMDTSEANTVRTSTSQVDGSGMIGHSKTMMANRFSYFMNFTGPSFQCDNAGTGGTLVLELAAKMIREGRAEAAVVSAANTFIFDSVDKEYEHLKFLSPERICYPFDERAQGVVRSEGIVSFFLQRAQDARRSYCTLLSAQTVYLGNKLDTFITLSADYEHFLTQTYKEAKVKPEEVAYIEANSCSLHEYDAVELNTISNIMKNKKSPVLIGSIAGNVGYSECVSGMMSIAKAIVAFETGVIPKTLNYSQPNCKVPGLFDGTLKPVTSNTNLEGDIISVTTLSLFGSVGHVLLKRNDHEKSKKKSEEERLPRDGLQRLVLFQARHESGALGVLNQISEASLDVEYAKLVNDCFKTEIPAYMWRGYAVLPHDGVKRFQGVQPFDPVKRPVWYIFSGMGSQWAGMGRDLLQFPVFAAAIDKCDKVLRPRGLDIRDIITTEDPTVFDNILNCFVGIAAIQIGLLDILTTVGISPDGMIGHSVGELGCAYADGCFSAEQMILAAYARGQASLESELIPGMMAAVGKGYQGMKDLVPDTVDIACHNSADSCTLSGPTEDINNYVDILKSKGIFAKAVSAGGIAYHSRYIQTVGPKLLQFLKKAIPDPKPRSSKWISSSVPEAEWNTDKAKLCSAEYHTNNLLSPVLFEEACRHLPHNAILVEIAPRGLLQAILKRSIGPDSVSISLTSNTVSMNVVSVFNSLGRLYLYNVDVDVNALYPPVGYPVSRNTPGLAPLVTWQHDTEYYVEFLKRYNVLHSKSRKESGVLEVSHFAPAYTEWKQSTINEHVIVPLSSLLLDIKNVFKNQNNSIDEGGLAFEDVTIRKYIPVATEDRTFIINYSNVTGSFEISRNDESPFAAAQHFINGTICKVHSQINYDVLQSHMDEGIEADDANEMNGSELYSEMAAMGLRLDTKSQIITCFSMLNTGCTALVQWNGDIACFLNAIFNVIVAFHLEQHQQLLLPSYFTKLTVDFAYLNKAPTESTLKVHYDHRCNRLVCDAVELLGLTLSPVPDPESTHTTWSEMKLQPYFDTKLSVSEFLDKSLQLAAEIGMSFWKKMPLQLEVIILHNEISNEDLAQYLMNLLKVNSDMKFNSRRITLSSAKDLTKNGLEQCHLILGSGKDILELNTSIDLDAGIYFLAYFTTNNFTASTGQLQPILNTKHDGVRLALLKSGERDFQTKAVVEASDSDWLKDLRKVIQEDTSTKPVILYSHILSPRQILPVLAQEPYVDRIRAVFVMDEDAPSFHPQTPFYKSQLKFGLPVNILSGKVWSSLRKFHVDLEPSSSTIENILKLENTTNAIQFVGLNPKSIWLIDDPLLIEASEEVQYLDYSGLKDGKKMMGVATLDPVSKTVSLDPILQWEAPDSWSLEDLATVPATYTLAYFSLIEAKLQSSHSVLVHLGMSLLGQALINLCLNFGATVYASVEDNDEAIDIGKLFPQLEPAKILILERQELKTKLKLKTKGKGVDLIFNGHRGKYLQEAIQLTASHGTFFHLCDIKAEENEHLGLAALFNNTMYRSTSLKSAMELDTSYKMQLHLIIQSGMQNSIIKPFKRNIFQCIQQIEAIREMYTDHMSKKSVISVNSTPILKLNSCDVERLIILITGKTEFWLDVIEWIVDQRSHKVVILNSEKEISNHSLKRLNRLIDNKHILLTFTSTVHLDTKDNATLFLKNTTCMGTVTSVFCIEQDGNSAEMKNLDWACREVLPELEQFVCLLGEGTAVSESREASGLPVISVQSRTSLRSPRHILPYLATILHDNKNSGATFYMLEDGSNFKHIKDEADYKSYLPSNEDDMLFINSEISDSNQFHEEVTLSPGYAHVSHCLLPVFIIPGLGSQPLKPLIKQLINPAFCSYLTSTVNSIEILAETLLTEITRIQSHGPYNILGESWSGPVALAVSLMLEAKGHKVHLILIEAAPHTVQNRISALSNEFDSDIKKAIASHLKKSSEMIQPQESIGKTETTLSSLLTSVAQHVPSFENLRGDLTVVTCTPVLPEDLQEISKIGTKTPTYCCTYDHTYQQLLCNPATATFINEHVAFSWDN